MMHPYRVTHRTTATYYYVLAASSTEAIEKITLHIADLEGLAAWTARPETPPCKLTKGAVVDAEGNTIKTLMA